MLQMRAKQVKRGLVLLATALLVSRLVVSPCRSFCSQKPSQRHSLGRLAAPNKDPQRIKPVEESARDEVDALTLARRQLKLALDLLEMAVEDLVDRADVQVDRALENLQKAKETGDEEKVKEAEEKVKEAEEKVAKAKEEVKAAKEEVEKAEAKVEAQQEKVPGFQSLTELLESLTELLGRLLFPDAVLLNDRNATYSSASSYIVTLDRGPFNGRLAQNNKSQAELLDREQEVQLIVEMLLERSNDLKGKSASDKSLSPALLVAQAPGAGKSHFLAVLGEKIPMLYDLDGKNQTPIVSAFTYNSEMDFAISDNLNADLALRVLYGATRHMSGTKCSWREFLQEWKPLQIDINLAVRILRTWYGDRPVVILADEVGKSNDEALVRQQLCRTMDVWGGQVFVVMSALTNYAAAVEMFRGQRRNVHIITLTVLGTDAYDLFSTKLSELQQNQGEGINRGVLQYRISLCWGATGGYARAIEKIVEYIQEMAEGLKAGIVSRATARLRSVSSLPPEFSTEVLETLLKMWEQQGRPWEHGCPFQLLVDIVKEMPEATYNGSVLIDPTKGGLLQRLYLPTVAPWHAADFFTSVYKTELANMPPRCAKLMDVAGIAYKKKVDAIESTNVQTMKQASSYFTEVVAAIAAMFAIVKKYKKLPPVLTQSESARSICDIGFDDSLSQDEKLATKGRDDADEKLVSFWGRAVELSKQKGNEQPFLVIMAPPRCKAVDFLIYCQDQRGFVAVQVKSNFVTEAKTQNEQKAALLQAAKDIRSASDRLKLVACLAVVGSNYADTEDLEADTLYCLQQEDLVALIPPFLRQLSGLAAKVQSVEGEDA